MLDGLTNWYIRFNRKRLKGTADLGLADTKDALNTLLQVLFTLVRSLAPYIPFITDHIFGLLKPYLGELLEKFPDSRSVHFLPYPTVQDNLFDEVTERRVAAMQEVIELGRVAREKQNITLKTPLLSLVVIADAQHLEDVESLQNYIKEELNVRELVLSSDEEKYNIRLEARVDWPTLGKKLKKDVQKVKKALPNLSQEDLKSYQRDGSIKVDGIQLDETDLNIIRVFANETAKASEKDGPQFEAAFSTDVIVLLDCAPHPELLDDGLVRDMINRVQKMRKKAGLVPTDDIRMRYSVNSNPDGVDVDTLVTSREPLFISALRAPMERLAGDIPAESIIFEEDQTLGNLSMKMWLLKLQ